MRERKVIVILGSGSPHGFLLARAMGLEGYRLIMIDESDKRLQNTQLIMRGLGSEHDYEVCDSKHPREWEALLAKTKRRFGTIDVVFHCLEEQNHAASVLAFQSDMVKATCQVLLDQGKGQLIQVLSLPEGQFNYQEADRAAFQYGIYGMTMAFRRQMTPRGIGIHLMVLAQIPDPLAGEEAYAEYSERLSQVAQAWRTFDERRAVLVVPRWAWFTFHLSRVLPQPWHDGLMQMGAEVKKLRLRPFSSDV